MMTMKVTTAMSVVLLLQTTVAVATSLGMYKSCLYECLHCINTWGKVIFNGELCAENCAMSGGATIDTTCTAYFTRSSRRDGGGGGAGGGRVVGSPSSSSSSSSSGNSRHRQQLSGRQNPSAMRVRVRGGYGGGYGAGYRVRNYDNYASSALSSSALSSAPRSGYYRSSLSADCQRLCRTCESRYDSNMYAHSCMYTCVSTRRRLIAC